MPLPEGNTLKPGDIYEVKEGEIYGICSCGFSKKLPFCDSSHKTKAPEYKSIKVEVKRGGVVKIY